MTTSHKNHSSSWARTMTQIYAGDDATVHPFLVKFLYIRYAIIFILM